MGLVVSCGGRTCATPTCPANLTVTECCSYDNGASCAGSGTDGTGYCHTGKANCEGGCSSTEVEATFVACAVPDSSAEAANQTVGCCSHGDHTES